MSSASWLPPGAQQLLTGGARKRVRAVSLPLPLEGIDFILSLREKATVRKVTGILFFTRVPGRQRGAELCEDGGGRGALAVPVVLRGAGPRCGGRRSRSIGPFAARAAVG